MAYEQLLFSAEKKRNLNRKIFSVVGSKYNIATRVLSFGRDRAWKKHMVSLLPEKEPERILDIASGSGDFLTLLKNKYPRATVLGSDLTFAMVDVKPNRTNTITLQDMQHLALRNNSVDIVTGGYALRNAPDLDATLEEVHRVLRPGGTAAFLDFAKPATPLAARINCALLSLWGQVWSILLHGKTNIYTYIPESLKTYPHAGQLRQKMYAHGFHRFRRKGLFFGFTEIIRIEKETHGTA
jgi:demethylmenaquinone methyltransferase/2-methoxy-6-polyprenyl-1,4-benzoquinol methylase